VEYHSLGDEGLAALRSHRVGFVFQFHHLLREFTALENVMLPQRIAGLAEAPARSRAEELLASVDLAGRMTHEPSRLSGGEQQRVAVARALANDPLLLLADEPSGNLDAHNAERLHDLFGGLARRFETAVVVVTHNRGLAERADRVLALVDGKLLPTTGAEVVR
jgi:lipoprotein-releasing system ATP-binding protein